MAPTKTLKIRLIFILFFFICFLLSLLVLHEAIGLSIEDLNSSSGILVDIKTGQILFEKNSHQKNYPASITKVLTALVALENVQDINQEMFSSKEALNGVISGGMHIFIWEDEIMKFSELLHALLIPSANDAANIIAYNVFGNTETFINRMNTRAKELGANESNFTNPNGLHQSSHYTTAFDMALIARRAMANSLFRKIVGTTKYTLEPTNRHAAWDVINTSNTFLYFTSEYFSKVTGVKTGYTNDAKFTLIASAQNDDGIELLAVCMNAPSRTASNQDCKKMLDYGFQNYEKAIIAPKSIIVATVDVNNSSETLDVLLATDAVILKDRDKDVDVTSEVIINGALSAPIVKDQIVGVMNYYNEGVLVVSVPIMAAFDVALDGSALSSITPLLILRVFLFILLGLFVCFVLLILFVRIMVKTRKRRRLRQTRARARANTVSYKKYQ